MVPLGNVFTEDVQEIWQRGYDGLRREMVAGTEPEACRICPDRQFMHAAPADLDGFSASALPTVQRPDWVFSTPEREFLRLAAMVEPNWDAIRACVEAGLDYWILRTTALAHQLDGVVAWRLSDGRMTGIVPDDVLEASGRHLDWLADYNRDYWQQVAAFLATLDAHGVPYAVQGGPAQYAPLGMEVWPRCWTDLDIDLNVSDDAKVVDVIEASGAQVTYEWYRWRRLALPGGTRIELWPYPLNLADDKDGGDTWSSFDAPTKRVMMLGLEMEMPATTLAVARMAARTWRRVVAEAAPLPLWALARLAAGMQEPDFSMSALETMCQTNVSAKQGGPDGVVAERALWTLALADRLYGTGLPNVPAAQDPEMMVETREPKHPAQATHNQEHYVQWQWPGDEAMLFDHRFCEGLEARLAGGIWKRIGRQGRRWRNENGKRIYEP